MFSRLKGNRSSATHAKIEFVRLADIEQMTSQLLLNANNWHEVLSISCVLCGLKE